METEPGAREREGPAVPASSRAVTGVGVGGLCGSEGGGGHTRGVGGREHSMKRDSLRGVALTHRRGQCALLPARPRGSRVEMGAERGPFFNVQRKPAHNGRVGCY